MVQADRVQESTADEIVSARLPDTAMAFGNQTRVCRSRATESACFSSLSVATGTRTHLILPAACKREYGTRDSHRQLGAQVVDVVSILGTRHVEPRPHKANGCCLDL